MTTQSPPPATTINVLLVEDHDGQAKLMKTLIDTQLPPYTVVATVTTNQGLLKKMKEAPKLFSIILADLHLGQDSCLDAIRILYNLGDDTPVVLLTVDEDQLWEIEKKCAEFPNIGGFLAKGMAGPGSKSSQRPFAAVLKAKLDFALTRHNALATRLKAIGQEAQAEAHLSDFMSRWHALTPAEAQRLLSEAVSSQEFAGWGKPKWITWWLDVQRKLQVIKKLGDKIAK